MSERKALIVGISGVSSSGKTTLSRCLRDVLPRVFILHEDDFYKTDEEIPVNNGVADWDCIDALNLPALEQALTHIRQHGKSPPDLVSKEDKNSVGEVSIDHSVLESLKRSAKKWRNVDLPPIAIIDGFLLYSEDMKAIRDQFDVKLFLWTDFKTAKTRREARSGYVTLEGFWEDPPGYVENVVWPNYAHDHAYLFKDGNVEGQFDDRVLKSLDLKPMPIEAQGNLTVCLQWAYDILDETLSSLSSSKFQDVSHTIISEHK